LLLAPLYVRDMTGESESQLWCKLRGSVAKRQRSFNQVMLHLLGE
jgi:hypothetical protein